MNKILENACIFVSIALNSGHCGSCGGKRSGTGYVSALKHSKHCYS